MPESLFLIKLQARPATSLKKETLAQVFSFEFCEIFKNTFFTENLRVTASVSIALTKRMDIAPNENKLIRKVFTEMLSVLA